MSYGSLANYDIDDFLSTFRTRVAEDLKIMASLHDKEPDQTQIDELKKIDFPFCLTILPDSGPGAEAMALFQQSLAEFSKYIDRETLDNLAADYAAIYLNHNLSASPEESVWIDEDSLVCQDTMFQVRGWYEKYGLGIPDWRLRPDDHLVYELQFLAWMLDQDDKPETLEQLAIFMDEHLLRWLGNFGERVLARCDTQYFAGLAALTAAYCEELRDIIAEILGQARPSREEIDERMKPGRAKPEEMPVQFVPGIGPAV